MRAAALAAGARRLTASEWWLLAESAALALAVEAALRTVPLARILRAVEHWTPSPDAVDRAAVERIARLARWPYRLLPIPASCLRVSLVQTAVLRRRGLPAALRLGVRRSAGTVDFHAWVECGGAVEAEAAAYSAFDLPAPREGRYQ